MPDTTPLRLPTSELAGARLDWAVAAALQLKCGDSRIVKVCRQEPTTPAWIECETSPGSAPCFHRFSPSTDWAKAGPIIASSGIGFYKANGSTWWAQPYGGEYIACGATPLQAAMRCFVVTILGDMVTLPPMLA